MNKLDLHGVKHEEVELMVENFVLMNQDSVPLTIITGNSQRMHDLVFAVVSRIDCDTVESWGRGKIVVHRI